MQDKPGIYKVNFRAKLIHSWTNDQTKLKQLVHLLTNFSTCLDAPKSANLMHPLLSTSIFAPWILKKKTVMPH